MLRAVPCNGARARRLQSPLHARHGDQVAQCGRGQALVRVLLADAVADFGRLRVDALEVGAPHQRAVPVADWRGLALVSSIAGTITHGCCWPCLTLFLQYPA